LAEIDTVPEDLQLELIDMQSYHRLDGLFNFVILTEFHMIHYLTTSPVWKILL